MHKLHSTVNNFFEETLIDLNCHQDTKAYIISIYTKYQSAKYDLSKDSVTLLFAQARNKQDFLTYQNLGDWIFFTNSVAPNFLKYASKDYYDTIARLSYYSCYRLTNRQWKLFEQLADEFIVLKNEVKNKLDLVKSTHYLK